MKNREKNVTNQEEAAVPDLTEIKNRAIEAGFTYAAKLDCSTLELLEEVRAMCASNSCGRYDKNWSCPPGCGSLTECRQQVKGYRFGILVQTVGALEDSMDFEGMQETEQRHKEAFLAMAEALRERYPRLLPLGTGCCTLCQSCTYPEQPCRFPEKRISSMEAYGILVSDLCTKNHLKYYYGPNTIAYTSCYLLD